MTWGYREALDTRRLEVCRTISSAGIDTRNSWVHCWVNLQGRVGSELCGRSIQCRIQNRESPE
jgi:hypothetical protein